MKNFFIEWSRILHTFQKFIGICHVEPQNFAQFAQTDIGELKNFHD